MNLSDLTPYDQLLLKDLVEWRLPESLVKHLRTEARIAFEHLLSLKLIDNGNGQNYTANVSGMMLIRGHDTPPKGVKVLEDV